ncbi:hypothetical protein QDX23_04250 [Auritidibacter ignavus]|uniref:hypothetical protein n=1 Tax=Auritidibacter ignavus TaxID=678932 RepID=UPI001304D0B3|nr:hypothetical protein [Auritidibacter ignavus]WGH91579.1 hypothetical protein QDX23_04250 [Auritidibacter ignavus]
MNDDVELTDARLLEILQTLDGIQDQDIATERQRYEQVLDQLQDHLNDPNAAGPTL